MNLSRTAKTIKKIEEAESKLLSLLKSPYTVKQVRLENNRELHTELHTLVVNPESTGTPLVLLHGLGFSLACWIVILDKFAEDRPVYCLDLPGWGLSSRDKIPGDIPELETYYVEMLEEWRKTQGLEKFVIAGYSMGGYYAICYTLRYQSRIQQLVLIDPWGLAEKPARIPDVLGVQNRLGIFFLRKFSSKVCAFFFVRRFGRLGRWMAKKAGKGNFDGLRRYPSSDLIIAEVEAYIYYCFLLKPAGESVFKRICDSPVYAKFPLLSRLETLTVSIHIIHPEESYVPRASEEKLRQVIADAELEITIVKGDHHDTLGNSPQIPGIINDKIKELERIVEEVTVL